MLTVRPLAAISMPGGAGLYGPRIRYGARWP
jgi:hypothetical protein